MNKLQAAEQLRRAIQLFAATLADDKAMEIASVFPVYEIGKAYAAGDIISFGENGVGDAQLYRVVQAHTAAEGWAPGETPALYTPIGLTPEGYTLWSQPTGAHDAYNPGDIVDYQGVLYISTINGNVWVPPSYGWEIYTEG